RSADRLGANEVDSSSRGNRGQKGDGGAPLKERGTRVTTRGSYSDYALLSCKEALIEEVNGECGGAEREEVIPDRAKGDQGRDKAAGQGPRLGCKAGPGRRPRLRRMAAAAVTAAAVAAVLAAAAAVVTAGAAAAVTAAAVAVTAGAAAAVTAAAADVTAEAATAITTAAVAANGRGGSGSGSKGDGRGSRGGGSGSRGDGSSC
ncbi:unnamed protein product, partial [Closterium sp. NIES-65]